MYNPVTAVSTSRSGITGILTSAAVLTVSSILVGCAGEPEKDWLGIDIRLSPPPVGSQPATSAAAAVDQDVDFRFMKELGVAQLRADLMNWSRIQPTPESRFDFSWPDSVVRLAQQSSIDILAVCGPIPAWASSSAAPGLPALDKGSSFSAFARAFVERYDGDGVGDMPGLRRPIRAYEFIPEMEGSPTADYAACLKLFHDAVKAANSKGRVVLGSLTSPGVRDEGRPIADHHTWFERLLADPALQGPGYPYFDVVGFFNYPRRFAGRPPFEHAVTYLQQAMNGRHFNRPLWLTGFGASSSGTLEGAEQRQAADLVSWAIHGRTLGIHRMYLHTLMDAPAAGNRQPADAFGLLRVPAPGGQVAPKPTFHAIKMLLGILKTQGQVTRRADGIYMLSGQKEPTYVLWRVPSYDPSSFLIPGWWSVRTLSGQETVRQGSEIKLTDQPIFIQSTRSPFIR